jgi:hypothetical protein
MRKRGDRLEQIGASPADAASVEIKGFSIRMSYPRSDQKRTSSLASDLGYSCVKSSRATANSITGKQAYLAPSGRVERPLSGHDSHELYATTLSTPMNAT